MVQATVEFAADDGSVTCPLVIVTWLDSRQTEGAWQFMSAFKKQKPIKVASVGWLIQDDDEVKVIAQSVGGLQEEDGSDAQSAGRKVIPTRCVISVEKLEEEIDRTDASASETGA